MEKKLINQSVTYKLRPIPPLQKKKDLKKLQVISIVNESF